MKITKRQLRRIIKEEKTRLLNEQPDVMNQLHTAIDALIGALGNEGARQELLGIVEDWEGEEEEPDARPDPWDGMSFG